MTQPLFLEPEVYAAEKVAADTRLSDDPNNWAQDILQELYKQVPYIADFQPHVDMQKVDAEQGYGFGQVEVSNQTEAQALATPESQAAAGIQKVRIPVIIREGKLIAFDTMLTPDSKVLPLTEDRLRSVIFRPQAFDVTAVPPGDQSMLGQLYPPFRDGAALDGAAGYKEAGALDSYLFGDPAEQDKTASKTNELFTKLKGAVSAIKGTKAKEWEQIANKHSKNAPNSHSASGVLADAAGRYAKKERARTNQARGRLAKGTAVAGGAGLAGIGTVGGTKQASGLVDYLLKSARAEGAKSEEKAYNELGTPQDLDLSQNALPLGARPDFPGKREYGGGLEAPATENGAGATSSTRTFKDAKMAMVKAASGLSEDYYKNPQRHGRLGKHSVSMDAELGALDAFIAKHASGSLLDAVLPTISASDHAAFVTFCSSNRNQLLKNAHAMAPSVERILTAQPITVDKLAEANNSLVRPTVRQLSRHGGGYVLKTASHLAWAPTVRHLTRKEAIKLAGEEDVMQADMNGAVTSGEDLQAPPPEEAQQAPQAEPAPVEDTGVYQVWTDDGQELEGIVAANLIDIDGKRVPLNLFTDGEFKATQVDIIGSPIEPISTLPNVSEPGGEGVFFGPSAEGDLAVTIPLLIQGSYGGVDMPTAFQASTFDGRAVSISLHEGAPEPVGNGAALILPGTWQWCSLDGLQDISLATTEPPAPEEAAEGAMPQEGPPMPAQVAPGAPPAPQGAEPVKQASARTRFGHVTVRSSGQDTFTFSGLPVEKLASAERENVNLDQAMFLLAGLGTDLDYGVSKLAVAMTGKRPEKVKIARAIRRMEDLREEATKTASAVLQRFPNLKRNLWKEAAQLPDPGAVDTVLSLGFLNPENVLSFIGYLPELEETQQRICELLLASRLGQGELPEAALERTVRHLEEIIVGLKSMAFQGL